MHKFLSLLILITSATNAYACSCIGLKYTDEYINGNGAIWVIEITSIDSYRAARSYQSGKETKSINAEYEKVGFKVVNQIRGKSKDKIGYFTQSKNMCMKYVDLGRKYLLFNAKNVLELESCDTSLMDLTHKILTIQDLELFAKNERIDSASQRIKFFYDSCIKSRRLNCNDVLNKEREKFCTFGNDNPKECYEIP